MTGDAARPYLWQGRLLTLLSSLVGYETLPHSLNGSNHVAGQSATVRGGLQPHGFMASKGSIADLGVLQEFVTSRAFAITDSGVIAGACRDSNDSWRAVCWYGGTIRDLNSFLPATAGFVLNEARAIDTQGAITAAGTVFPSGGIGMACLLRPVVGLSADVNGDCLVNVPDLLAVINEWHKTTSPADINDDGLVDVVDLYEVIRQWTLQ